MARNEIIENDSKQYIVVKVENERYGIDIQFIDNIVRMTAITRVPKAQHYYRGVINMRGEVVPVMSLRRRMSLEDDVFTNASRILIVKPEASALLGFIVDEVLGVVVLQSSEVEKVAYSREEKDMYINGIGKTDGQLISLLDLKRVIGEREFED